MRSFDNIGTTLLENIYLSTFESTYVNTCVLYVYAMNAASWSTNAFIINITRYYNKVGIDKRHRRYVIIMIVYYSGSSACMGPVFAYRKHVARAVGRHRCDL